MQKVYASTELSNAVIVRDLLASNGIDAFVFNENAAGTMVVGAGIVHAEVWVETLRQATRAKQLIREYQADESHEEHWACAACQEENPGSFAVCWSCGRPEGGIDV